MKQFFTLALPVLSTLAMALPVQAQNLPKDPPKLNLSAPLPANLFVELAKAINPAVVNISTSALPRNNPRMRDPMMDMLEQLYGIRMQPQQQSNKPQQIGLGTGFIIREDGLIVTNNHVIQGADQIQVQLSEGSKDVYDAVLIGSDARTDIALIKITPKGKVPYAVLGSSKDLEVGEWVAAFGNPFGHGHSMTKGLISSKGRDITEINKIPLLQTDASINPGNSGGPLVNTKGQVIGVNSAIDARAQGIGFAIPIDDVKALIPQLESKGRIARGYIGTALGDIDAEAAEYLGLGDTRGAVITQLDPRGPAAKAGVKMYDIVTEFNGRKITNSLELQDAVADATIGKSVKASLLRNRKPVTVSMLITERPEDAPKKASPKKAYQGQKAPFNLGFTVLDPNDQLRAEMGLPDDMRQPVVIDTVMNSAASKAGLQAGDVILDVNKNSVETSKDVLKSLKKGSNTLRIARNARIQIINIETN
ncbi:trypsin-like peptidase domain-containing protein [Bdellovibrio svalbardensis]|uniref:Probable periplasmic serine endoprotease DegP-like n=1 Tax=Bdellovibrio svalbardensis TaxID=2972972 RepID=A0ABT6DL27_9BACT|nr:trypsin-like peptidase domain-containing protein [Bdellovibrio svalbardensis]MDG0815823.1 trypsin-like peptidase domain-containing protein [Bdellovibrio svalbardensis]